MKITRKELRLIVESEVLSEMSPVAALGAAAGRGLLLGTGISMIALNLLLVDYLLGRLSDSDKRFPMVEAAFSSLDPRIQTSLRAMAEAIGALPGEAKEAAIKGFVKIIEGLTADIEGLFDDPGVEMADEDRFGESEV